MSGGGSDLGDAALHDEEVRVVDVELDRVEQVLHLAGLHGVAVEHVLVLAAQNHLMTWPFDIA